MMMLILGACAGIAIAGYGAAFALTGLMPGQSDSLLRRGVVALVGGIMLFAVCLRGLV